MKILHVFHHSNLVNGVDRTTLTLLRAVRRLGAEVVAVVPETGDVTAALDAERVDYRIAHLGCCCGPAKMAELAYLARAASRTATIEAVIGEEVVDIVHLNTGHLLDAAIAAARAGVPAIWHIHAPFEVDLQRYIGIMPAQGYQWLLAGLGSHVIGVSEDVRVSLIPFVPENRVSTLYNGIDVGDVEERAGLEGMSLREELGLTADTALVLGVGRICAQKDFATFVRVADLVVRAHGSVCFAIAGPPEDRELYERLERSIVDLGLSNRVFILGPRTDVPALLARSDAFLSTAQFEGQGLAALEAMALRKPVVAMDCVGLRACVVDGEDGFLVPLGDEAACASAVLRVLKDKELAARLGAQGRRHVEGQFSAEAYARGFLEIAERAIAENEPGERAGAASFALGLLNEVREVHERLLKAASAPKTLKGYLRAQLQRLFAQAR